MAHITSHYRSPSPSRTVESNPACITFTSFALDRYAIEEHPDGPLLRESGEARIISLTGGHELLEKLAKVHEGRVTPLAFAAEYGLLGETRLTIATHQWQRDDGAVIPPKTPGRADKLAWFMERAAEVFRVLCLLEALETKDVNAINAAFVPLEDALKDPKLMADIESITFAGDPIELARLEIKRLIQPHLEGINRELVITAEGFRSCFKARALVDLVYWKLADLAQGVSEGSSCVRHCKECRVLFIANDYRRQFCSTKCQNRAGVAAYRQREKLQTKGKGKDGKRKGRKS